MKIKIGKNDNLSEGEYELTNPNKLQNAIGNLSYGGSDREKLIEYDRIAGRVVKDGAILPPQSLWKLEQAHSNKPIDQFTEEELLTVIRRAENTDIPGSLYQRANKELEIRCQIESSRISKLWYKKPIGIIIISVIATLIAAYLVFRFGWNR
ncbi:MAG: hypothetical protein UU66_C0029G0005 [Parcubacteria group bacterium GW2011_GWB1_41_5]|nr:MAG: hypothetical protein UU66_C0029G0005 [Parcubacteria group bacterium GW2011_GWB1_41_5]KKS33647.1 MAG: hypothetical protein UU96_C0018G0017 [Parcubacteria group bacterium GW2011_GWC2_42_13]KKS55976.1 MAG: hypothetical protein UV22_C0038G0005 [Parcubacteria group bacterium GW2011_GWA2_42_35]